MKTHIEYTPDETGKTLCGRFLQDKWRVSRHALATAVKIEDEVEDLCQGCKRSVRARFGSIKRWDRAEA